MRDVLPRPSTDRRPRPAVVILDPGNFTPYYVDNLARVLNRHGRRVRVITSPPLFEPIDADGCYETEWLFFGWLKGAAHRLLRRRTRLRQALKSLTYPFGLWRTWRALRTDRAGVLHVQWALFPALDALLLRLLRRRGWRVVFTVHDQLPGPSSRAAHYGYQRAFASADSLIVHTAGHARRLASAYPDAADKVRVIPHGGQVLRVPSSSERADARRSFGAGPDDPVLLFFGMIKPYKGLEYLLDAMPAVIAAFPRARLLVAGELFVPLSTIERRIASLGIAGSVRLRASFVPQDESAAYFAAADLLVAPYVEVGASGVVVMAQGYGVPVVATDTGGLPELVGDACGVIVRPRSAEALAEGICSALSDRSELAAMGRRSRRQVAREGNWTNVAKLTLDVYQARDDRPLRPGPT